MATHPQELAPQGTATASTTAATPTGVLSGTYGLPMTFWLFGIVGTLVFHGLLFGLVVVTPWVTLEIAAELLKVAFAAMVCEAVMNASARYTGPVVWVVLARIYVVATLLLSLAWYYGLFYGTAINPIG